MIFNYKDFINELKNDHEDYQIMEKYEELIGPIGEKPLGSEVWYIQLVKPFARFDEYAVPNELKDDFDWGLLAQLSAASLSSEQKFIIENDSIELQIYVTLEENTIIKKLSELLSYQIYRLFEIWIKENISLCTLIYEDEKEKKQIFFQKKVAYNKWMDILKKTIRKKKE